MTQRLARAWTAALAFACACERAPTPDRPAASGGEDGVWFTEITGPSGLDFVHENGATGERQMPEIMGGGGALFDFDNDGRLDIYLVNGAFAWGGGANQPQPRNRLFRQKGDGTFEDVTDQSGLGDPGYGMGVAVGDIDNDGFADVYVTNFGPDRLYRNQGNGTFTDITASAAVDVDGWSASAVFCDFDRDGFLDLYVTRYLAYDSRKRCVDSVGRPDYCGPRDFPNLPDVLLHNEGDGTFRDVTAAAGIGVPPAPGLGVVCEDLNDDGWLDFYVANDMEANHLWINRQDGTFRETAILNGAAYNLDGQAESGMGVIAFDLDGDLATDIFVTHLGEQTNTAYKNVGPSAGFTDATGEWGLAQSSVPYTGFGTAAFDADCDGDADLAVANGRVFRGSSRPAQGTTLSQPWDLYAEPNLFYLNQGGSRFELACDRAGSMCARIEISRVLVAGDIDADGDLDLLITNIKSPARLYRNDAPRRGHWLSIRARDPRLRRDAIGARVSVHIGDRVIVRSITANSGYLSSHPPETHFGLGTADRVDAVEVRWPDGSHESFPGFAAGQQLELLRGTGSDPG